MKSILDKRIRFDEKMDNCLYFNVPCDCFPNLTFENNDDMCDLSIDVHTDNIGVLTSVRVDICEWIDVEIPQDEIVELLKLALRDIKDI